MTIITSDNGSLPISCFEYFLPTLFPDPESQIELLALPGAFGGVYRCGDRDRQQEFLRNHAGFNLYFCTATRQTTVNGTAEYERLGLLWSVIWFKNISEPEAQRRLAQFPLRPSTIVAKGSGLDFYWLLSAPVDLRADTPRVKQVLEGLAHRLGGETNAADPVHMLHLPGTVNWDASPVRRVSIELFNPAHRYSLDEVAALFRKRTARQAPQIGPVVQIPETGFLGVAREFADLFAAYLESPRSFFYFCFLTYFGALVAKMITIDSELRSQPRLYVVIIGESADTRKSTALHKVDEFFRSLGPPWSPSVLFGVGSAEGLARELQGDPKLILHFDEMKAFVDKAKSEHSVALPMVSTLFDRGDYDNATKQRRVQVRDASLSMVAASTPETFATIFDRQFLAIGFPNRLWLVSDRSTRRHSVPRPIPEKRVSRLRHLTVERLKAIRAAYVANGGQPVAFRMTRGAKEAFDSWYMAREGSIFERRLDTYGHRLMLLLAATSGRDCIDKDIAERVIALLRYQVDVRRECDPIDAENTIASVEEKIRRVLAREPLKDRALKRRVHYERVGL